MVDIHGHDEEGAGDAGQARRRRRRNWRGSRSRASRAAAWCEITLTGKGEMKAIRLDPSLLTPADKEMVEDLILAAFADAKAKADRAGGGEDAEPDGGPAVAAGHETAVLRRHVVERRRAGNRAADPAAGAPAGARAALGAPRRAASHPQARAVARAARRGDARRPRADRRPARSAATSTRAIPARSAPTSGATARRWSSSNRSAISGRWSARKRRARAITCSAARCRRSTASGPTTSISPASSRASPRAGCKEVVLAVNATVDGQTTAHYVTELLSPYAGQGHAPGPRRAGRRRTRLSRRRHARGGDAPAHDVLTRKPASRRAAIPPPRRRSAWLGVGSSPSVVGVDSASGCLAERHSQFESRSR